MLSYCLKYKKDRDSINPKASKARNEKTVLPSNCAMFNTKTSRFIKEQEASGLLSNLRIIIPLSKIPLLGDMLFWKYQAF